MHHHAKWKKEIRVQIRETPLFYVPNDFEINGLTKEHEFHFNAGTMTKTQCNYSFHNKSHVFLYLFLYV